MKKIRILIIIFIAALFFSGITAFPMETELRLILKYINFGENEFSNWLNFAHTGISNTNLEYKFFAYGTDWLAFAHIMFAVLFIGPLKDPFKNIWVIQFGMIASLSILPLAFIAGSIREIPFFWQLIDCSFGVIGFAVMFICYKEIKKVSESKS